jgi:riboflavin biosynthesis pyrimidine reductase
LFEAPDLPVGPLPPTLAELYDGGISISDGSVYANFVTSIDGIAALEGGSAPSGGIISGRNEADRFVMGLLRAFADAIVVGAGTLRAEGGRALWTSDFIFPAAADGFRLFRRTLKRDASPRLVIVTARGELDPADRALHAGALVLTTAAAAGQLRKVVPNATEVRAISEADHLEVGDIFDAVQAEGHRTILTEGGPKLFGQLVADDRVDELFLTVSPVLAGRKHDRSFGIINDMDFGRVHKRSRLLSMRRHESYLFLRYRLDHLPPHVGQARVGA